MPKKKQDSFFFQNRDENVIKQNRRAFAQSDALKEYFMQRGVNTLEDLESLHATAGLGTIFGFKSHSKIEMARQLAAYGTFSNKIATYTRNQQEEIAQKIIKGLQWGNFSSCFFTDIDPTVEQENREALLKTHAVQQFFVREGIDLYNITGTVQTERGRRFMQRYFSGITPRKAEYRKIVTQWTNVEEAGLRFLAGWYGTPDQIIDSVHAHKEWYQEHHGRTVAAILQKMQHMGLLPLPQSGPSRQNGKVAYPFPQIHVEEYPDTPLEFRNLSYMFGQGVIPNHVAVLGYDSASHTQFSHATVPVVYRGVDFSKYNAAEQEALCMIAMYLADRDTFGKEPNGDLKEKHTIVKGHPQPAIIQLKMDDGTKYCQLIFRRRFNPGSCTQTEALITHNATYLHLKHDGPVSFAGTRE